MKSISLFITLMLGFALTATAQLYVNVQAGYAVPTAVTAFDLNDINAAVGADFEPTSYSESLVVGTNGGGIIPALTVGYMFNENLGAEITGSYLLGSTTSAIATVQSPVGTLTNSLERSTSQIRVAPTLVVKGSGESVKPYAKFGALIPVAGETTSELIMSEPDFPAGGVTTEAGTIKTQGKITVGFQGSFGVEYPLSDNIAVFGEVAFQALSIQGKSSEITAFTVNGQDVLGLLPTSTTMINYVDELNLNSNNLDLNPNFNPDQASEELRPVSPYSNVGINLGVSIGL